MNLLGEYDNGNYNVKIFDDGTKIRETEADVWLPEFAESMDVKITNYCDMGCPYCHENSTKMGEHGDILNESFINSIHPYTEVAIGGGNPLSHPDLIEFLNMLKAKNVIANITVNQKHFMEDFRFINNLAKHNLIHGLGVSFTTYSNDFVKKFSRFPNAVLHVINGIISVDDLQKLSRKNLKVLILGYKDIRRGKTYHSKEVDMNKDMLYNRMIDVLSWFDVVSFDNLSIEQLDVRRLMFKSQWEKFYMGNDGHFTFYVDLVQQEFAKSSVSQKRYDLIDSVDDMFNVVKNESQ